MPASRLAIWLSSWAITRSPAWTTCTSCWRNCPSAFRPPSCSFEKTAGCSVSWCRVSIREANPLCLWCGRLGCTVQARRPHHKISEKRDSDSASALTLLFTLCGCGCDMAAKTNSTFRHFWPASLGPSRPVAKAKVIRALLPLSMLAMVFGAAGQALPPAGTIKADCLHNVYRVTDRLYSGSSPEGDAGFAALVKLGIKTIISVDGAKPDLERARKAELRYVHLPIGYDGVPERQSWLLAKAVRDLPGPVYLHCHHGKHRGPAAAAVVHFCLDEQCTVATAIAEMRRAGTDPHYIGLYAAPRNLRRPTKEELDALPADFPEVALVSGLAQHMVAIEEHFGRMKLIRAAGWKAPPGDPDIDPAHEALQLREHYRESARLPDVHMRPAEFRDWLEAAHQDAGALETILREVKTQGAVNTKRAEELFRKAAAAC